MRGARLPAMSEEKRRSRLFAATEMAGATILSFAGLGSAWASYQAALWDGEQAANYSIANTIRVEASGGRLESDMHVLVDVAGFSAWLDAMAVEDTRLAEFYRARFLPEFRASFESWLAMTPLRNPDAPPTPFAMPGYVPAGRAEAARREAEAAAAFAEGQEANRVSDVFVRGSVILATAMFFAGIGQVFKGAAVRVVLAVLAGGILLLGGAQILSLPVLAPG